MKPLFPSPGNVPSLLTKWPFLILRTHSFHLPTLLSPSFSQGNASLHDETALALPQIPLEGNVILSFPLWFFGSFIANAILKWFHLHFFYFVFWTFRLWSFKLQDFYPTYASGRNKRHGENNNREDTGFLKFLLNGNSNQLTMSTDFSHASGQGKE